VSLCRKYAVFGCFEGVVYVVVLAVGHGNGGVSYVER
jgi:hypothetical protein